MFGLAALMTTIILFFITPYVGILIDRYSRKKLHITYNVIGFIIMGIFGFWGLSNNLLNWQLITIYMSGTFYYGFHYPTLTALNQELFSKKQYPTLNSTMEVLSQSSAMISGALGSILIVKWGLPYILLIDASTYLVASNRYSKINLTLHLE